MSKDHQLVTVGQLGAGGICSVCLAPDKPIRYCLQQWPQEFECLKSLSHLSQWSPEVRKTHFYWELSGANLLLRIIWLAWVTDTNFFIKWQNITSFQCLHMLTHHGALTSPLVQRTQSSNTVLDQNLPFTLSIQFSGFRNSCNWETELLDHHVSWSLQCGHRISFSNSSFERNNKYQKDMSFRKKKTLLVWFRPFKRNVLIFGAWVMNSPLETSGLLP